MILDKLENKDLYINIHPLFKRAFEYVEEFQKNPVAPGEYEIEGRDLFVKVLDSETRLEGFLETHDKYIDIQVMLNGEEKVYCDWGNKLTPNMPYNEVDDAQFYADGDGNIEFTLSTGEFAIFFSHDAHKPAMVLGNKQTICKKLVFKVKI